VIARRLWTLAEGGVGGSQTVNWKDEAGDLGTRRTGEEGCRTGKVPLERQGEAARRVRRHGNRAIDYKAQ